MSPEEKALRDAWIAEMWPTVYQYVRPAEPFARPVDKAGEKPRKGAA